MCITNRLYSEEIGCTATFNAKRMFSSLMLKKQHCLTKKLLKIHHKLPTCNLS